MSDKILKWLLPLTIIGFMGPSIRFLSPYLNTNTRWIFLGMITLYCLLAPPVSKQIRSLLLLLLLGAVWNYMTCMWSEQLNLSLLKATGAFMTTLFVFLAGFLWSTRFGVRKSLDYLKLFSLVALFSTIAGYFFSPRPFHTLGFYLGWCSNVNMNGVLTSVTSAYLLWLIYTYTANKRYRALLFALYAVNLVAVVGTGSRAAMLIVLLIVLGYLVGSGKTQAILIIPAAVGVLVVGMMTYEPLNDWIMGRFVTKFDQEALMTRRDPWQQSLEGAREGGLLGGGYGVSIGFASNWQGDRLSATDEGYGREKGNSQLAIIEETGLIGLLFYVILQCYIFYSLIRGTLHARDGTQRVALGIVTGLAFGLFVQSCFEGWYVAPGALESVLFWSTIGVGFGVVKQGPDTATSAFRPPKGRFTALRPYRIAT